MAVRTTAAAVKAILKNSQLETTTVDVFITAASALVDNKLGTDTTLGSTLLTEIEKWLAAHMIASTLERTTSKEKVGDVSVEYTGKWEKNLESTPYGQMVVTLDTTGTMAALGRKSARIIAIESFDD
jgi:hypothetical protein